MVDCKETDLGTFAPLSNEIDKAKYPAPKIVDLELNDVRPDGLYSACLDQKF